ncbi:hypothetical protein NSPZN2_100035 [Nitrospira defluvii]|uniref:Transposase n=1 Tax=Nitrospira defluvii TaxID=330214 RepID=A0ABM8QZ78_9BACT|nr:hypothetical protein NSPZN2_100035 [Nitrospira defluvii]
MRQTTVTQDSALKAVVAGLLSFDRRDLGQRGCRRGAFMIENLKRVGETAILPRRTGADRHCAMSIRLLLGTSCVRIHS